MRRGGGLTVRADRGPEGAGTLKDPDEADESEPHGRTLIRTMFR